MLLQTIARVHLFRVAAKTPVSISILQSSLPLEPATPPTKTMPMLMSGVLPTVTIPAYLFSRIVEPEPLFVTRMSAVTRGVMPLLTSKSVI